MGITTDAAEHPPPTHLVDVAHHLLARGPGQVLGDLPAGRRQHDHRADDHNDVGGGRAERLELAERVLVERVERRLGLRDDRLGRLEVLLALGLEGGWGGWGGWSGWGGWGGWNGWGWLGWLGVFGVVEVVGVVGVG